MMVTVSVHSPTLKYTVQSPESMYVSHTKHACITKLTYHFKLLLTLLVVRNSKLVFKLRYGAECHVSFYSLRYNQIGTAGAESLGTALKECTKLESLE